VNREISTSFGAEKVRIFRGGEKNSHRRLGRTKCIASTPSLSLPFKSGGGGKGAVKRWILSEGNDEKRRGIAGGALLPPFRKGR